MSVVYDCVRSHKQRQMSKSCIEFDETLMAGSDNWKLPCQVFASDSIQIFVMDSERRIFLCNRVCNGRSRSFKIVDFVINGKGACDFLLVVNINLDPILHRFWYTATYRPKNTNLPYPTFIQLPRSGWALSNFWMNFLSPRLESLGYPLVLTLWSYSLRHFDSVPAVTDGQTGGLTDEQCDRS